jgi:hypothetical protein
MRIVRLNGAGSGYTYRWPSGTEDYDYFVDYVAAAEDGEHTIKIGFCKRHAYGKDRQRVVVWIDDYPSAEFVEADDFARSGEVVSEIKISDGNSKRMCRYPNEPVPERYGMFNVAGLPLRVQGEKVHNAWAVVASIADHKTLVALAALRRLERRR